MYVWCRAASTLTWGRAEEAGSAGPSLASAGSPEEWSAVAGAQGSTVPPGHPTGTQSPWPWCGWVMSVGAPARWSAHSDASLVAATQISIRFWVWRSCACACACCVDCVLVPAYRRRTRSGHCEEWWVVVTAERLSGHTTFIVYRSRSEEPSHWRGDNLCSVSTTTFATDREI